MNHWEHFEHGADVGVRGFGRTLSDAFEQAALAMTAVVSDLDSIEPNEPIAVACSAPDDELLLVDWLNAVIYEMATRRMLFSQFDIRVAEHSLDGRIWGEKVSIDKHKPSVEIKGATYTNLSVGRPSNDQWIAECVVDV